MDKKNERSELDKQLEKNHKNLLLKEITKRVFRELAMIGAATIIAYLIELLLDFA